MQRQAPRPGVLFVCLVALVMLGALQGCALSTRTMLELGDVAVPRATTAEAVRSAFVTAGSRRGWAFSDAGAGKLTGVRADTQLFTLTIEVVHSASSYRINYVDSSGLNYSPGRIHSRYNRWLRQLNKDVQALLNAGSHGL